VAGEALEKVFPMAGASALGKAAHWRLDEVRVDAAADAEGAARDADVGRVERADADVARGDVHEHAGILLVSGKGHGGGRGLQPDKPKAPGQRATRRYNCRNSRATGRGAAALL